MASTFNPSLLFPMANGAFINALGNSYEELWGSPTNGRFFRIVPSELAQEFVPWVGEPARPIKITQAINAQSGSPPQLIPEESISIGMSDAFIKFVHDTWSVTIEVGRDLLEDSNDNGGFLMERIQQATQAAVLLPNRIFADMLHANPNAYDGIALFGSHTGGRADAPGSAVGTQSNTSAISALDALTINQAIGTAVAAILKFQAENGEPLFDAASDFVVAANPNNVQNLYMALESAFLSAWAGSTAYGPSSNLWAMQRGRFNIMPMVSGRITSADNNFYVLQVKGIPTPPAMCFQRQAPMMEVLGPGTTPWVQQRKFIAVISGRLSLNPLHWGTYYRLTHS